MKKIIDRFSAIFAEEKFLAGSVAATLLFYAVNLVAKVLCGLYSLFIVDLIFFLCVVALFVNHFIINGDHHSRSANVFLNQLLVIVIAVLSIVSMCFQCFLFDGEFASSLEALSWHTGLAALVLMIAAYESRFNAYKLKRESAEE